MFTVCAASPEAADGSELPLGAGNRIQVPCRNSKCSKPPRKPSLFQLVFNIPVELSLVATLCNHSTWEAETGRLYRFEVRIGETLSQNNKQPFPKKYKKQNDDSIELTNQMNADDNNFNSSAKMSWQGRGIGV